MIRKAWCIPGLVLLATSCVAIQEEPSAPVTGIGVAGRVRELLDRDNPAEALEAALNAPGAEGMPALMDRALDVLASRAATPEEKVIAEYDRHMVAALRSGTTKMPVVPADAWIDSLLDKGMVQAAHSVATLGWTSPPGEETASRLALATPARDPEGAGNPSGYMSATVTVWVDRGISVHKGLGTPERVVGSGFFIDPSGYIITNHHVIASEVDPSYEGYSRLYINLPGTRAERIPAKVMAWSEFLDLALLKVEVDAPRIIDMVPGLPRQAPGDAVYALGSPGALDHTITAGIVSSWGRRFLAMGEVMQIDASVNPGNSGGPLLDASGRLVGIVFAGVADFQGVNFALPARYLQTVLPFLAEGGELALPWLGMTMAEYRNGLICTGITSDSPAWRAGFRQGDHIDALNGIPVHDIISAQDLMTTFRPGMIIRVDRRKGDSGRLLDGTSAPVESICVLAGSRPKNPLARDVSGGFRLAMMPSVFGIHAEWNGKAGFHIPLKVDEVIPGSIADEFGIGEGDTMDILAWQYLAREKVVQVMANIRRKSHGWFENRIILTAGADNPDFL